MHTTPVDVSVVVSTYNRCQRLAGALKAILSQVPPAPSFELIVVDNNSTDDTWAVVTDLAARDPRVRYVFEAKQGLAHGWNAGIVAAQAPIVAFTDDDLLVSECWLSGIATAFREYPDAWFVAGKVLPEWPGPVPRWLTSKHWAPLSLTDYGNVPFSVSASFPRCLPNAAFRAETFRKVGLFSVEYTRVKDSIGSTEDHELQLRIWKAGGKGWYVPFIETKSPVSPERMEKAYHRRWHSGHGKFAEMMQLREIIGADDHLLEPGHGKRAWGVPGHVIRSSAEALRRWATSRLSRDASERFQREVELRAIFSYVHSRMRRTRER